MSKQKKDQTVEDEHYPIYVQSSNPDKTLLDWMCEMSKKTVIYFQSGKPAGDPPPPPGGNP